MQVQLPVLERRVPLGRGRLAAYIHPRGSAHQTQQRGGRQAGEARARAAAATANVEQAAVAGFGAARTRHSGDAGHDVVKGDVSLEVLQRGEQRLHLLLRREAAEHLLEHRAHLVQRHARAAAALLREGGAEVLLREARVVLQADEVHVERALRPQLRQAEEGHGQSQR